MTYDEALIFKMAFPIPHIVGGLEMKLYVTPNKQEDFMKWCDNYRTMSKYKDEYAKLFATDNKFKVHGICYKGHLFYDDLTKSNTKNI